VSRRDASTRAGTFVFLSDVICLLLEKEKEEGKNIFHVFFFFF